MLDEHYIHPRLVAIYDDLNSWGADNEFYLSLAGSEPKDILDLGCGTGALAAAYAKRGHRVTGVDPASAMLQVARGREVQGAIDWIEGTAQDFRSDRKFDLVIMTGHAVQALLTDQDFSATLQAVSGVLKEEGEFVFETRNPQIDWATRWDNASRTVHTASGTVLEVLKVLKVTRQTVSFQSHYTFNDQTLLSQSELRFRHLNEIEASLSSCGLFVKELFGDWSKGRFVEESSLEMITVVGKR